MLAKQTKRSDPKSRLRSLIDKRPEKYFDTQVKVLVVVPDGNPIFPIWCIEYSLKLISEGNKVDFLDLQDLNTHIFGKRFKKWIFNISRKNRSRAIVNTLCNKYGINELKLANQPLPNIEVTLGFEAEETFRLAMSSKYGAKFGSRFVTLEEIPRNIVNQERLFFLITYLNVQKVIVDKQIDCLVSVNGRLVVSAAVVAATRSLGIPIVLLEAVGNLGDRYHVFDRSPHDLRELQEAQMSLWNGASKLRNEVAKAFFRENYESRLSIQKSVEYTFTQEFKLLDQNRKIASFFPTTETEYPVFTDFYTSPVFGGSQQKAFLEFATIAASFDFHVIVRAHPQSPDLDNLEEKEDEIWEKLCKEVGASFISASSGVNSYDLIKKSDLCVTYGSSIGIETIYMGIPFIILGESDYSRYIPNNCGFDSEKINVLLENGIPEITLDALHPWAYWNACGGFPLHLFQIESGFKVIYEGREVDEMKFWYRNLKTVAGKLRILN